MIALDSEFFNMGLLPPLSTHFRNAQSQRAVFGVHSERFLREFPGGRFRQRGIDRSSLQLKVYLWV